MSQTIVIQLGKNGDLISLLPCLKAHASNGNRCAVMVCEKYAPLLEGVSYVDVISFRGGIHELRTAYTEARKLSDRVISTQVMGPLDEVQECSYAPAGGDHAMTDSFVKESWRLCGMLSLWKTQPPVVFDRRSAEREAALFGKLKKELGYNKAYGTQLVLLSLSGESSPFPHRELLRELVEGRRRAKRRVIDLSEIKAERLYDLVGLLEMAHCLITTDSALLHLAAAVPTLPVLAITQDNPSFWHGSPWRASHVFQCRYRDFSSEAVKMLDRMDSIGQPGCFTRRQVLGGEFPRILHVYSGADITDANRPQFLEARKTWIKEYAKGMWTETCIDAGAVGRDSKTALHDDKRFPFLKDVVRLAASRAADRDILCLTRGTTAFSSGITEEILKHAPCYSHRVIMDGVVPSFHPGVDVFCFTKAWWNAHRNEIPDFVLGNDAHWHRSLMELMKFNAATDVAWIGYRENVASAPLQTSTKAKRVEHNEKLADELRLRDGGRPLFLAAKHQQPTAMVNRHALFPSGYNPSIIRFGNRLLMAYRHHTAGVATSLAMVELDENLNVLTNRPIEHPAGSHSMEDGRLFEFRGQLWMSYVDSTLTAERMNSVVRVARLVDGNPWTLADVWTPEYGCNDGSAMEKNWVFFAAQEKLFAIYSQGPKEQVTLEFDGKKIAAEHRTPSLNTLDHERRGGERGSKWPRWAFGMAKGGTVPLPYGDRLIRFFHSTLDNESVPHRRRYYVGACTMKKEPPFEVIEFSGEPLLCGSEDDDSTEIERSACPHFKPKVVFPGGSAWAKPGSLDSALLSFGINDHQCAVATIGNFRL